MPLLKADILFSLAPKCILETDMALELERGEAVGKVQIPEGTITLSWSNQGLTLESLLEKRQS